MLILKTFALFVLTALAEILGCYLPYVWLRKSGSPWLLAPAAASLVLFAWLLTLHPAAAGRVYAAYGGRLHRSRIGLAVEGGWRAFEPLGYDGRGGCAFRHGHYRMGRVSSLHT